MLRLLGATLTVAATTVDDAVWLVPFLLSHQLAIHVRILHGLIFIATLQAMVLFCIIESLVIGWFVTKDYLLSAIGAGLCWAIAIFLFVRKWIRRRRRQMQIASDAQSCQELLLESNMDGEENKQAGSNYGSMPTTLAETNGKESDDNENDLQFSPCTVITLTFMGALDEVSYFPGLILGKVFSILDLCLGTLLAACLIVTLIGVLFSRCQPLLKFLDRIPLYAVLVLFATILTFGAVLDYSMDKTG